MARNTRAKAALLVAAGSEGPKREIVEEGFVNVEDAAERFRRA